MDKWLFVKLTGDSVEESVSMHVYSGDHSLYPSRESVQKICDTIYGIMTEMQDKVVSMK